MPRFRFTIRAALLLVAAFACWLGMKVYHAEQQKRAITAIEAIDGYWYYDFQFVPPDTYLPDEYPDGPAWFWRLVDVNLFHDVVAVGLNSKPATDETVRKVSRLGELKQLDLADAAGVTNRGLDLLEPLDELIYLRLDGTSIDSGRIDEYQRRHPNVEVVR